MQNARIQCRTLYDIYQPISGYDGIRDIKLHNNVCRMGIIGRVTITKGLHDISRFCEYCEQHITSFQLEFHFYGGIDSHICEVASFVERANLYFMVLSKIKFIFTNQ